LTSIANYLIKAEAEGVERGVCVYVPAVGREKNDTYAGVWTLEEEEIEVRVESPAMREKSCAKPSRDHTVEANRPFSFSRIREQRHPANLNNNLHSPYPSFSLWSLQTQQSVNTSQNSSEWVTQR
jgi:hypothetical protein